jgi:hypothetical protein
VKYEAVPWYPYSDKLFWINPQGAPPNEMSLFDPNGNYLYQIIDNGDQWEVQVVDSISLGDSVSYTDVPVSKCLQSANLATTESPKFL